MREGVIMKEITYHNPCDDLYALPMCSCGSERENELSQVFWWSAHPWPIFGSAGLLYKQNKIKMLPTDAWKKRG